jgi:hypothetical protein
MFEILTFLKKKYRAFGFDCPIVNNNYLTSGNPNYSVGRGQEHCCSKLAYAKS